jgi:Sec-independent protein translocase protein TatA
MLDNFGMGEFLMLAIFALLFFGPERLPQMGARLGRWLGQLTQASKVFMTQWTEEAAAIQDAVREVQGIRDEIRAAQAEISGSLDMARQDIEQTIGEARSTVRDAAVTPQAILQAGAPPRLATPEEVEKVTSTAAPSSPGGEAQALSKTQSILDDLVAKRGLPPAAADEPGDDGTAPAEAPAQESEYERNLKAIQEIQERSARRSAEKAEEAAAEADQAAAPSLPAGSPSSPVEQEDRVEPAQQDAGKVRESAFDKTQRILDGLLGKAPPEPEAKAETGTEAASAGEASEQAASAEQLPSDNISAEAFSAEEADAAKAAAPVPAREIEPAGPAAEGTDRAEPPQEDAAASGAGAPDEASGPIAARPGAVQRVTGLQQGIGYSEFTKLSIEVTQLRRELRALQKELQALRVAAPGAAAEDDSQAVAMEEAA